RQVSFGVGHIGMDNALGTTLAVWGAITGTLALLIQFLAYRRNRARLKLRVDMYTHWHYPDPSDKKVFKLHVINSGQESSYIQLVGIEPYPLGSIFGVGGSTIPIFNEGDYVEISGGNKHVFTLPHVNERLLEKLGWLARAY